MNVGPTFGLGFRDLGLLSLKFSYSMRFFGSASTSVSLVRASGDEELGPIVYSPRLPRVFI